MVAAAATLWLMFSIWLMAPGAGLPRAMRRTAAALLGVELGVLLAWSYGTERCLERDCAPLAQALGTAARIDIPAFAALFVAVAIARRMRRA